MWSALYCVMPVWACLKDRLDKFGGIVSVFEQRA